jgi:glutathione S-transferase
VPIYEEPGLTLVQSGAIIRYLAKKHGYVGANANEQAHIDQAYEGVTDLRAPIMTVAFTSEGEQKAAAREKLITETVPRQLAFFNKLLEKNGNTGFLVGSKLSYVDLALFEALRQLFTRLEAHREGLLGGFPAVKKLVDGVSERERVKAYLARDVYKNN